MWSVNKVIFNGIVLTYPLRGPGVAVIMPVMKHDTALVIKIGQKLVSKRHKTIYLVRNIEEKSVVLVSEDGGKNLRIPVESISPEEYEPL